MSLESLGSGPDLDREESLQRRLMASMTLPLAGKNFRAGETMLAEEAAVHLIVSIDIAMSDVEIVVGGGSQ